MSTETPEIDALAARIIELEKLVYVPGLWRCAKCSFQLQQMNLHASTSTARISPMTDSSLGQEIVSAQTPPSRSASLCSKRTAPRERAQPGQDETRPTETGRSE